MMLIRTLALQLTLWTSTSALGSDDLSEVCGVEVDAQGYQNMKSKMLVIDVRTWNEYVGNDGCDSKCHMGHVPEGYFLQNDAREDKASVYKTSSTPKNYEIDAVILDALVRCYGNQKETMKIGFNCYSGFRSNLIQQQLVKAGFKCENIYNIQGGHRDLYKLWEGDGFKADSPYKFEKGDKSPGAFDWSTCPADKSGPAGTSIVVTTTPDSTQASGAFSLQVLSSLALGSTAVAMFV
jgi:rhodanese-related sulfurtransferase